MSETQAPAGPETRSFQAEVARLLQLMVHSVYTEKEIFLRELISNASDACDKLRYEAIARPELSSGDPRFAIRIVPDKAAGTLTIADNGIGMDRQELIDNLGTIARSGTRAFLDKVGGPGDANGAGAGTALIGQFGVGFYSAFMVADRVAVTSRKAGETTTWTWSSDGSGSFSVAAASPEDAARVARGTAVTLHLKADARAYAEPATLERVVRTWSDHILFPVELVDAEAKDEADKLRQINTASALWQRSRSEIGPEDYTAAYRTIAGQFDEPAHTLHYRAEGRQSYAVLLFFPASRPFDMFDPDRKGRVKLYVRRVYITDDAGLLPSYLRFVRGVVDSEDVPLNISREMLQNNPVVGQIRKALTQRVLSELEMLAGKESGSDAAKAFATIWAEFGAVLKEGIYEDYERSGQLLKLARFRTTATGAEDWRSLAQYLADMKPNQTEIYYLAGESLERLQASPQLEAARARGVEVLLLADPIDSFWTTMTQGFEGKPLRSLSQGEADLSLIPRLAPEVAPAASAVDTGVLIAGLKAALGDLVADVRASQRLVDSPSCLVASGQGPDRTLERMLARQARGTGAKPILEINAGHALVKAAAAKAAVPGGDLGDIAHLLLGQAYVLDGEVPPDPVRFMAGVNKLALGGLV